MVQRESRNSNRDVLIETYSDIVEHEDGGIYMRERVVGQESGTIGLDEFKAMMKQRADAKGHLSELLHEARVNAALLVRPHVIMNSEGTVNADQIYLEIDLGDGPERISLPAQLPEEVINAVDVLKAMNYLNFFMEGSNKDRIAFEAFRLGRLVEMLNVRPFEKLTLNGKRQKQNAITAGKARQRLTEEQQREAIATLNEMISKGMSKQAAAKKLALDFGVSYKTLLRHFAKPAKNSS